MTAICFWFFFSFLNVIQGHQKTETTESISSLWCSMLLNFSLHFKSWEMHHYLTFCQNCTGQIHSWWKTFNATKTEKISRCLWAHGVWLGCIRPTRHSTLLLPVCTKKSHGSLFEMVSSSPFISLLLRKKKKKKQVRLITWLPLESQHSRDKCWVKGKVALFRNPAAYYGC